MFNKLIILTTETSELSKYLNEQLGEFLNVKQQKWSYLIKQNFLYNAIFYWILMLLDFWKFMFSF